MCNLSALGYTWVLLRRVGARGCERSPQKGIKSQCCQPFWTPFWHRNREKRCRTIKKTRPAQQAKKSSISDAIPGGPFCCPDSKYHMFRRGCPCPFEWLWGAIWGHFLTTLPSKVPIWTSQGVSKKLSQKRSRKRATSNFERVWA